MPAVITSGMVGTVGLGMTDLEKFCELQRNTQREIQSVTGMYPVGLGSASPARQYWIWAAGNMNRNSENMNYFGLSGPPVNNRAFGRKRYFELPHLHAFKAR